MSSFQFFKSFKQSLASDNTKQPPPVAGKQDVTYLVIRDLSERAVIGQKKYGTRLMTHNGRRGLVDAYQEALDLCLYLKQVILEQNHQDNEQDNAPADNQ